MVDFSKNTRQATKACERYEEMGVSKDYKRLNLLMDLTAADGVNGNEPLDWERFLAADDFNFLHDLGGICRHINRETGKIEGFFVPRFTASPLFVPA